MAAKKKEKKETFQHQVGEFVLVMLAVTVAIFCAAFAFVTAISLATKLFV